METHCTAEPEKSMVQVSFFETGMGVFFFYWKSKRHVARKRLPFHEVLLSPLSLLYIHIVFLKDTFLFVWCVCFQIVLVVEIWVSFRYMPSMELGVLTDMPDIRKKATQKLLRQQVMSKLLLGVISLLIIVIWALDCLFCLCLFLFFIWN